MDKIKFIIILSVLLIMASCNPVTNKKDDSQNLLNKVNAVENQWIDYNGTIESDNSMMKSQFIPYNSNQDYIVNNDAYVSYYKGEDFITTELHEADTKLNSVEEANGIILSFNKENKNGIKLINKD
ncbi:hypothetical protein GCM10007275_06500 [Jeotgalicoccus coquinae]|uniref:Lipoprotein n=1 Tax=Jeotgalicoccus coquinae TaxID=709509 RepID=A0A6V7RBK9_9STAP|nr:hypothetical protein [Jeotgalicoccus coquinae]MBB6422682.1 hypothetical protein [Jeotgalicoccus coquinae]GGE14017.1 hypothetical protein GCM10007275_06500 [Jeotgalicoccus coquinae]CAD2074710.1 hypothetical protein JEOCOQ751_00997 [Jeotgalicoccus coquinae]